MSGDFLLDTNILIHFFNKDKNIAEQMSKSLVLYVPVAVVSELYYGAFNSKQTEINTKKLEDFLTTLVVLDANQATAMKFGEIKAQLKRLGKPIPENDIWIAATAIQHSLPLVTRDKHFEHIKSVETIYW